MLLLLLLGVGILWAQRGGRAITPATRAYLQLREACARAAELDAQERLMTILADLVISRLYAADLPQ